MIENILNKLNIEKMKFIEWMAANSLHKEARTLTYVEFLMH